MSSEAQGKRKPIGKRLRFEIFARDGFTCRYCGAQSDKAQLVIDHIIPVCQGGGNEVDNLLTSCAPCNAGKSGKTIDQHVPTEAHRLALAQEIQEQLAAAKAAKLAAEARDQFKQAICDYYCEARGRDSMNKSTLGVLRSLAEQHGPEMVFKWIDIAVKNLEERTPDNRFGAYICGIRRRWREEQGV